MRIAEIADARCKLCNAAIKEKRGPGGGFSWYYAGNGEVYHTDCHDLVLLAKAEAERDQARALVAEMLEVMDGFRIMSPAQDKARRLLAELE